MHKMGVSINGFLMVFNGFQMASIKDDIQK